MTRARVGSLGRVLVWGTFWLAVFVMTEEVPMVWAQSSEADSTLTDPMDPFAASADSTAIDPETGLPILSEAEEDSLALEALRAKLESQTGFVWVDFLGEGANQRPSITGSYRSDKSRFGPSLDLELPLLALGGFSSTTTYHRDRFEEPATEQFKQNVLFSTDWRRPMSNWGQFEMGFRNNQNSNERVGFEPSESGDTALTSALRGQGPLGQGVEGRWSIRGSITDKNVSSGSRSGATTQKLSKGIINGGLGRNLGAWKMGFNAGLDLSAGPQTLSASTDGADAQEETKTTISDTLGVNVVFQRGAQRSYSVKILRQALTEERLDFAKDERGVTIFDPDTNQKIVGNEREVRNVISADLAAQDKLIRNVRYNLRFGIESKETQYSLSQQNFIPEQAQTLGGDIWYRFAAAGSLKVSLNYVDRWDDRRLQDSDDYRGRHYSTSSAAAISFDQQVMATSALRLLYAEDLAQQTYDYKLAAGTQDSDVLGKRLEARLTSKPWTALTFSILGTYRTTSNVFLDPELVASNNRDQDSWKVTMDYDYAITPAASFSQSYQMSIEYTDYVYSYLEDDSQRDKFYKRTQLRTELGLRLIDATSFVLSHTLDRTRGGVKEIFFGVEDQAYTDDPSRRQDEQRVYAGVKMPVWGYLLDVGTNRTVRVQREADEEYLGDFRIQISGKSEFLDGRLQLGLNLGHVWAYGPPRVIRIPRDKRYFTSNTQLTWLF